MGYFMCVAESVADGFFLVYFLSSFLTQTFDQYQYQSLHSVVGLVSSHEMDLKIDPTPLGLSAHPL